jgi:phosphate transport system substrate-binding protein
MPRWIAGCIACLALPAAMAQEIVTVQGSSTVFPLVDAVAQELEAATARAISVELAVSGTAGGFEALCGKRTDVATASRPIVDAEDQACRANGVRYVEVPIALDALSIVVSPDNGFVQALDVAQLRRAWAADGAGSVVRWSDLDPSWPARAISLYSPDAKSGTHDYFNEALFGVRSGVRTDVSMSNSDYVLAQRIARDPDALGYFGAAYVAGSAGRVRAVPVVPPEGGEAVAPVLASVRAGRYQPFTRPLLVYVNVRSLRREAVAAYVDLLVARMARVAPEFGYVPLSAQTYEALARRVDRRTPGSVLGGQKPGAYRVDLIDALERGR